MSMRSASEDDVLLRHVGVDPRVDPHRARRDAALALQLGDRLVQHLDVELEADGGDVARTAPRRAARRRRGSRGRASRSRSRRRARCGRRASRAAPAPRASARAHRDRRDRRTRSRRSGRRGRGSGRAATRPSVSARSMISVFACGMSMPDSMIVVETSTSASPRRNACIFSSSSFSRICPCATRKREIRAELLQLLARPPRSSRRGCADRTPGPSRSCSRSSASLTCSSSYSPTVVRIGRRPSGGVSMIEMSRIPASDMCSVRGIGVALSVRTSTSSRSDFKQLLLRDAEALLLVEDDEPELLRDHVAAQHAVRADEDVDLALARSRRAPA